MAVAVTDNAIAQLNRSLLEQNFWQSELDGYWYPAARAASRVRIKTRDGAYTIETRRSGNVPWTLLVKAFVADFDRDTFASWCRDWPLRFT